MKLKLILGSLFAVLGCSTFAQLSTNEIAALRDLKSEANAAGLINLHEIARWANEPRLSGEVISNTPPNLVDANDKWAKAKIVVLKQVATSAGITRAELKEPVTVRNKISTWLDGLTTANKLEAMKILPVFYEALFSFLEASETVEETEQTDIGSQPVYGNSARERYGLSENITRDRIWEAFKTP